MNQDELKSILDEHKKYLNGIGGKIAYLRGADLRGADLSGAKGIISFGPVGNNGRIGHAVSAYKADDETTVYLGCHAADLNDTLAAIEKKYGPDSTYAALVVAAVRELES